MKIGLISDTHNLLRPEAESFLHQCDHIIHAGDIASEGIYTALQSIAPLTIVRGNNDWGEWCQGIPYTELVELNHVYLYVIHNLTEIDIDPIAAGIQIIVSGHSHHPHIQSTNQLLSINPGSAGPRRFGLPITVGELILTPETQPTARIIDLTHT